MAKIARVRKTGIKLGNIRKLSPKILSLLHMMACELDYRDKNRVASAVYPSIIESYKKLMQELREE